MTFRQFAVLYRRHEQARDRLFAIAGHSVGVLAAFSARPPKTPISASDIFPHLGRRLKRPSRVGNLRSPAFQDYLRGVFKARVAADRTKQE